MQAIRFKNPKNTDAYERLVLRLGVEMMEAENKTLTGRKCVEPIFQAGVYQSAEVRTLDRVS